MLQGIVSVEKSQAIHWLWHAMVTGPAPHSPAGVTHTMSAKCCQQTANSA